MSCSGGATGGAADGKHDVLLAIRQIGDRCGVKSRRQLHPPQLLTAVFVLSRQPIGLKTLTDKQQRPGQQRAAQFFEIAQWRQLQSLQPKQYSLMIPGAGALRPGAGRLH